MARATPRAEARSIASCRRSGGGWAGQGDRADQQPPGPFQQWLQGRRQGRGLDRLVGEASALIAAEATEAALAIGITAYQHDAAGPERIALQGGGVDAAFGRKRLVEGCSDAVVARAGRSGRRRCRAGPGRRPRWPGPPPRQSCSGRSLAGSPPSGPSRSIRASPKQSTWGGEHRFISRQGVSAQHGWIHCFIYCL